jgi:hypothetical protein
MNKKLVLLGILLLVCLTLSGCVTYGGYGYGYSYDYGYYDHPHSYSQYNYNYNYGYPYRNHHRDWNDHRHGSEHGSRHGR